MAGQGAREEEEALTSAERAHPDTEKEPGLLEGGGVQVQRLGQGLVLENGHFKRQFAVTACMSLFSTNSLPLPLPGSLSFEIPDFMMSKLSFNVY